MKKILIFTPIAFYFLVGCNSSTENVQEDVTNVATFVVITHERFLHSWQVNNALFDRLADAIQEVEKDQHAEVDTSALHSLLDSARVAIQLSKEAFAEQDSVTGDALAIKNKGLHYLAIADSCYHYFPDVIGLFSSKNPKRLSLVVGLFDVARLRRLKSAADDVQEDYNKLKEKYHYVEMDQTKEQVP